MKETVGYQIARSLADAGVTTIFGVISIHNMPIIDGIAEQRRIRFVPARGEAGAMNMADAFARVTGEIGVALTSTGIGAGNAAGAQVEALTAGTQLLHITTQVDREFMDRDRAAIHDVPKQPDMLKGISKQYFRIWDEKSVIGTLEAALSAAVSPPSGPVSLEIPVDVQRLDAIEFPAMLKPIAVYPVAQDAKIAQLAELVKKAKRPMIWLGGGSRQASVEAEELVRRGFGAVTSTQGRAVVAEANPASLGAFNMTSEAQAIYAACDLMIVVGSRLRGNETLNNKMKLPKPLIQIDVEPTQGGRNYAIDLFLHGEAKDTLSRLLKVLPDKLDVDPQQAEDIAIARDKSAAALREKLGPYQAVADTLLSRVHEGRHPWVRDVTISNSTFGNRYVQIAAPHLGVHSLGGGIGQGIAMGIGTAIGAKDTRTVTLLGDGGAMLGIAELITALDEQVNALFIIMNDSAYGVIENIQDAQYGGRRHYSKLKGYDYQKLCDSMDMPYMKVDAAETFEASFDQAMTVNGPMVLEVDMVKIGPFAESFSGPPAGAAGNKIKL